MGTYPNVQRLQRVILLGIGLLAGWSVNSAWPYLPERVASHFNAHGQPDRYMPREAFFTNMALLGGGAILFLLLIAGLPRVLPNKLINLPHRDYWLAPERRHETVQYLAIWSGWCAIATSVLLVAMLDLTLRANIAGTRLNAMGMCISLGVYLVVVLALIVSLFRKLNAVSS